MKEVANVLLVISQKDQLDLLFLDFKKAFDNVPHKRLLLKLSKYGISGKVLDWIEAFLTKRRDRAVLGESISEWKNIISGESQGSVIGPVQFIIYTNDLPDNLSNITKICVDDTKILVRML